MEGQQATPEMVKTLLKGEPSNVYGPEGVSIIYLPGEVKDVSGAYSWRWFSHIVKDNPVAASFSTGQSWSGGWAKVLPYFIRMGEVLEDYAHDRWESQMKLPERVVGTPFTEFTVNGTGYKSIMHRDKPRGPEFSTLSVLRRGEYTGGWLVFPERGVGIDMQDGDVVLLRACEWHAITPMSGDGRRISVVGTV